MTYLRNQLNSNPLKVISLHFKILYTPKNIIEEIISTCNNFYNHYDIRIQLTQLSDLSETQNIEYLHDIEIYSCNDSSLSNDQNILFNLRNNYIDGEIIVYVVKSIRNSNINKMFGCAAHPNNLVALIITHDAAILTLAHEIGHIYNLPDYDPEGSRCYDPKYIPNNIMTSCNLYNLNPNPIFEDQQLIKILNHIP